MLHATCYGCKLFAVSEDVVYVVDVEMLVAEMGANLLDGKVAIYDIFNAAVRAINLPLVVSA